jgi:hypothetical protein
VSEEQPKVTLAPAEEPDPDSAAGQELRRERSPP